jgi:hypothetical protein
MTWLKFVGLALEDMDELFSQDNVRGKFVPTRATVLEAVRDAKGEDGRFEHLERA